MTKKKSTLTKQTPKQTPVPTADVKPFGSTYILKDNILTPESELPDDGEYYPQPHLSKEEATALVFTNRAILFGEHTIGLGIQGKDNQYPFDALLFDLRIPEKPRLYLLALATELSQAMLSMMALNSYLANKANKEILLEELAAIAKKDKRFIKAIGEYLAEDRTLDILFESAVRKNLRGLCIINTDNQKDAQIVTSYLSAHGGQIDVIFLRVYKLQKQTVLSMVPSFDELKAETPKVAKEKVVHTIDHHYARSTEAIQRIYEAMLKIAVKIDKRIRFAPDGKHYVAMKLEGGKNLAFVHFRKGGLYTVVKLEEKLVRKMVKKSTIHSLPESVQRFWNGSSTGITFNSLDQVQEMTEVLRKLIKE